jgi:hypothetical protein
MNKNKEFGIKDSPKACADCGYKLANFEYMANRVTCFSCEYATEDSE